MEHTSCLFYAYTYISPVILTIYVIIENYLLLENNFYYYTQWGK